MPRILVVVSAALIAWAAVAEAQERSPIRVIELGGDISMQRNQGNDLLQRRSGPVSLLRFGASSSEHRWMLDQRVTVEDQRLVDSPSSWQIGTQLGWRLGSRARVNRSVLGPYLFSALSFSDAANQFRDADAPHRALLGFAGGLGTRVMIKGYVFRPELFLGYDPGRGAQGEDFWIPSRSNFGLRLGYGFHFPTASD